MQEFTIFDMVILGITLVLGLKGLFRGLIKEVFGIVGIIGAIFVASRAAGEIGNLIAPFLALENQTTIKLIGFIIALIGFWLIVYVLGVIVSKIFSASGLGLFDRIFGFVFGAAKVFLIFSVISYALYQVQSFKKAIDNKTAGSVVMPHLISVGSYIIKLDTSSITQNIEKTVDTVVDTAKEATTPKETEDTTPVKEIKETIEETKKDITDGVQSTINDVKKSVEEEVVKKVEETIVNTTNATEEQINTVKEKLQSIVNKTEENK
ncbi:CvpA family protein [Poseidonibacter ostreae]|jgi:membrane protein required for colicin V production|uniref:CvpA family protein n=1 Tax=Poseidonibacter ostreae TaxID=2654171 RepID=A0A6L4WUS6_9BACT|nr:CvpA family protein [Poseidonibacter ostreae]KAB7885648.1 CvpA family protein [Poseidonibacter ostreae]KAB7889868.1 CvpA family protein [Poseidonibacter ostreae]KAB7890189.1 CvpA family protein [Poseidonibacter ostreae]